MVATEKQLNLNDILNAEDTQTKRVDVPEWGGYVIIQTMTAEARDRYELSLLAMDDNGQPTGRDMSNVRAKLVACCTLGPDGRPMFKNDDHVKVLGAKNSKAVDRIYDACQQLNKISDSEIEELAGN